MLVSIKVNLCKDFSSKWPLLLRGISLTYTKTTNPTTATGQQGGGEMVENHTTPADDPLFQLVLEACQYPRGNLKQQQCLTQIMRLVEQSKQLWHEDTPGYEDALHNTWVHFGNNINQVSKGETRDPQFNNVISWFNQSLQIHLRDCSNNCDNPKDQVHDGENHLPTEDDTILNESVQVKSNQSLLEATHRWIEADPTGELQRVHIPNRPDINCQILMRRLLPPTTSWEQLALEYDLDVTQLSRFYQRECLPRLSKFGRGFWR